MNTEITLRNIWITMSALCSGTGMALKLTNAATAACDGKNMFIPKNWIYTNEQSVIDILLGVTVHEAMGHGRYTDFVKYSAYAKSTSSMGATLLNIFEDIYIETQCNKTKPGASASLSKMVEVLAKRDFFGRPDQFEASAVSNTASLVISGLLILCRARLLPDQHVHLAENVKSLEFLLENTLGDLWPKIWDIAQHAASSTSTEDSINLAKRVMTLIENQAQKNEHDRDENMPDKGPGGDSADSDGGDEQDDESAGSDDQESGNGDVDPVDRKSSVGKGDLASSSPSGSDQAVESRKKAFTAAKAIVDSKNDAMPETEVTAMASERIGQTMTQADPKTSAVITFEPNPNSSLFEENAERIAKKVSFLSDDLQDALMAETRCVRSTRMVGRRLNGRVLSRIRLGNPNVFIRKDVGEGLSTAVSLLLDDSGSMNSMRSWVNGLALGLGDILDEFEVQMEIACYSDKLAIAKSFEADWTTFRKTRKFPYLGGGTVTGGAAEQVLGSLVCREEERRLLVLVTDGDTCDMERLESVYSEAISQGIEIASVMLGATIPKVERLAKKFGFEAESCKNESDLSSYVLDCILQAI